jgi:hypothetical protein
MRRKCFAGASANEFKGMLVSWGFLRVREIRFTLPFREAITMAAGAGGRVPALVTDRPLAIAADAGATILGAHFWNTPAIRGRGWKRP